MNNKDLKKAIVNGVILHDNFLREDGVNLNTDMCCDGNKLISRILAASNLLAVKYKGEGFNNKFVVTNNYIYNKLKLESFFDTLCNDHFNNNIYIVDDMNKNYVCVGLKDDCSKSYTFIIE